MTQSDNRGHKERRKQGRRWSSRERRQGGDRRLGAYSEFAQRLPTAYVELNGRPRERVMKLVREYCDGCDEKLQADLAQALLPTLQGIGKFDDGNIMDEHRAACEAVVKTCVLKNEIETGRWDTACVSKLE